MPWHPTGNWLYLCLPQRKRGQEQNKDLQVGHLHLPLLPPPSTPPPVELDSDLEDTPTPMKDNFADEPKCYPFPAPGLRSKLHSSMLREAETVSCSPTKRTPPSTPLKPAFVSSTPLKPAFVSSTPRQRQCMAITRTGLKCRLQATPGATRCHRHGN